MNTENNHQNHQGLEICPDCGNWTRSPDHLFCSICFKPTNRMGRWDRIQLANARGVLTLCRLKTRLIELREDEEKYQDYLWAKADAEVLKKIVDEALLCKRDKSDIENRREEVETRFEQLLDENPAYSKICRAISGTSWAIRSLQKFLAELKQKNNKTVVPV